MAVGGIPHLDREEHAANGGTEGGGDADGTADGEHLHAQRLRALDRREERHRLEQHHHEAARDVHEGPLGIRGGRRNGLGEMGLRSGGCDQRHQASAFRAQR